MKLLLINPIENKPVTSNVPEVFENEIDRLPSLGLLYIAAYLEKHSNNEIKILDAKIENLNYEELESRIRMENPDAVGLTAITFLLLDVIKTIKLIKAINPKIKIILGGPHINIYPEETMNIPEVDFLVLGEGERPVKALLDNIDNISALYDVKGIVFRDNGKIVNTGRGELIENLDELPFPARHLTPYKKYHSMLSPESFVTTMFTSRGCPYKCLFCDRPHLGKVFRARSARNVVDEMEECYKMGIKEIIIFDDTFGADRQRVLDICALIKERKLDLIWDIRTRVNTVDEEVLIALKSAGCHRIHYGVEAGTTRILNVLRKGITLEQVEKAFRLTKKVGIETLGYFMIGSPSETIEDIESTMRLAKKLDPDYAHFSITTPFPATDLYLKGLEQKILPYDIWREFAKNPTEEFEPLFWEENFTRAELIVLLKKAYNSFYFRPKYILRKLLKLGSWHDLITKARVAFNLFRNTR